MEYLAHKLAVIVGSAIEIGLIAGVVYIGYRIIKKLIEYRVDYEQDRKTAKDAEAEIYKTAAEIEHQLNEDKP